MATATLTSQVLNRENFLPLATQIQQKQNLSAFLQVQKEVVNMWAIGGNMPYPDAI